MNAKNHSTFSIRSCFSTILILVTFPIACRQVQHEDRKQTEIIFKVYFDPSFDETSEIILYSNNDSQSVSILIKDRRAANKIQDTFYFRSQDISKDQYHHFDSAVIRKARMGLSHFQRGLVDGMPVRLVFIDKKDTTRSYFRNPYINVDTAGYKITKAAIDNFRIIFKDSIINDYFDDIESYMDDSKNHIKSTDKHPINRIRRIEYSR